MSVLGWLGVIVITAYVGFTAVVYFGQRSLMYFPETVRTSPTAAPRIYLAAPAQQLDLMAYYRFQSDCFRSKDFNAERVLSAIRARRPVNLIDGLVYRIVNDPADADITTCGNPDFPCPSARRHRKK